MKLEGKRNNKDLGEVGEARNMIKIYCTKLTKTNKSKNVKGTKLYLSFDSNIPKVAKYTKEMIPAYQIIDISMFILGLLIAFIKWN